MSDLFKPLGSDFVPMKSQFAKKCSECGVTYPAGFEWLVSARHGKVMKRVCSEKCRQDFDDRFWQARADQREALV